MEYSDGELSTLATPVVAISHKYEKREDAILAGMMLGIDIALSAPDLGKRMADMAGDILDAERDPAVLKELTDTLSALFGVADLLKVIEQ